MISVKENDLTGTFIADLVLQMLSYVAQTEREFIRRRQAEGIESAKKRGVRFGREKEPLPQEFEEVRDDYINGRISVRKTAERCKMSPSTFYRKAKEMQTIYDIAKSIDLNKSVVYNEIANYQNGAVK
ncbi:MAG: recombinase family protein [Clostridia bacterium]|nr:recombinase family protein [Clostridia bacterium]